MPRSARVAKVRAILLRGFAAVALCVGGAVAWNFATGNLGEVEPARVYRSAQLRAVDLSHQIAAHRIKTVLNLRGQNPDQAWYRDELAATLAAGATQVDIALSSRVWMSRSQLRALIDALETCEKPMLIHCWRGSERTGMTAAFATLLREGATLDDARAQFSMRYLFIRAGEGVTTIRQYEAYESWLAAQGAEHTPGNFRRWVAEGFTPDSPSREEWPYDPYPLVVVTRPGPDGPVESKVWDARGSIDRAAVAGGSGPKIR